VIEHMLDRCTVEEYKINWDTALDPN
jgi:hypothetical protein